jgi:transketolase
VVYGEIGGTVDVEIFSTGSEVHPSLDVAMCLEKEGFLVRLISVPSWELFTKQTEQYKNKIRMGNARLKVSVEAGSGLGWQYFVGDKGLIISQETFGASAPEPVMADHFGFTSEKIVDKIKSVLKN